MCCAYCRTDHQAEFDLTVLTILLSSTECWQHCVYIEKNLHKTFKMFAALIADDIQTLRTRWLQHVDWKYLRYNFLKQWAAFWSCKCCTLGAAIYRKIIEWMFFHSSRDLFRYPLHLQAGTKKVCHHQSSTFKETHVIWGIGLTGKPHLELR